MEVSNIYRESILNARVGVGTQYDTGTVIMNESVFI